MNKSHDSAEYLQKKSAYRQLLTVYGRKPVLEALQDSNLSCFRLHLADSNKPAPVIRELEQLAKKKQVDILYHDRPSLSRISKNGKQDQGVCLDIHCPSHQDYTDFLKSHRSNSSISSDDTTSVKTDSTTHNKTHSPTNGLTNGPTKKLRILALDRITNPQNMGMIIRSACAGNIDGILISEKGCAKLDALVIKGSAGTLFKAPILRCGQLETALQDSQSRGATVVGLTGHAQQTLASFEEPNFTIYIVGNETEGMSQTIENLCDKTVFIPMKNQVESLNVAVTASLLAFRGSI